MAAGAVGTRRGCRLPRIKWKLEKYGANAGKPMLQVPGVLSREDLALLENILT